MLDCLVTMRAICLGLIDACGDSRLAEGVAIKGAANSLAPDLELGLAPENKVSTLDNIF